MSKTCRRGHHTPHRTILAHTIPDTLVSKAALVWSVFVFQLGRHVVAAIRSWSIWLTPASHPSTLPLKTTQREKKKTGLWRSIACMRAPFQDRGAGKQLESFGLPTSET